MSQYIQLQQVMIDLMVVKVGGDNGCLHIVGRALDRSEGIDRPPHRQHDNSPGMLSGSAPHPDTALQEPLNLFVSLMDLLLVKIFTDIAIGRLIGQRTDSPGTEGLSCAKDDFRIIVSLTLVFTREIQIDIRFLVPIESKECLKGNVMPVPHQRLPALRAVLRRHVKTGASGKSAHLFRIKVCIMALLAIIMRRQGIYLCDTGHGGHKGGAHRTAGTHQVSVLIGFPNQLLGDNVHHGKPVFDNGIQFVLQTL